MAKHSQNWFIRLVTIVILLLKVCVPRCAAVILVTPSRKIPTVLAFAAALRNRGTQFSGLGFRGNDLQGATGASLTF